jgi:predicted secreted hydrolase
MVPVDFWTSSGGGHYPVEWRVKIPARQTELLIKPALNDQELTLGPIVYWEGAVDATGTRGGQPLKGRGYLELTGYAGRLKESLSGVR